MVIHRRGFISDIVYADVLVAISGFYLYEYFFYNVWISIFICIRSNAGKSLLLERRVQLTKIQNIHALVNMFFETTGSMPMHVDKKPVF